VKKIGFVKVLEWCQQSSTFPELPRGVKFQLQVWRSKTLQL